MTDWEYVFESICEELGCAFDNEAALMAIANLKRRVVVLETVIFEDLPVEECSDGLNLMIVEGIIERGRPTLPTC